ncbi:MAG: imidazoleglycerol-phosphate dehydratase HisB [Ruminococcaceae bacterium]|nr:imidazoleglycerol-phosphate dehydratase HisB [Oscillospiraceae bacterium]
MREAIVERKTRETDIYVKVCLDGGEVKIDTGIGFFDHMLTALGKHGGMGLEVRVKGDLEVDCHHTIEDTGIALGQAIREALGDMRGIRRYADCRIPMDEALAECALDISGRAYLVFHAEFTNPACGGYDCCMTEEFMRALAFNAGITLHLGCPYGKNDHHKIEALYKALARALRAAMRVEGTEIPSTKGVL